MGASSVCVCVCVCRVWVLCSSHVYMMHVCAGHASVCVMCVWSQCTYLTVIKLYFLLKKLPKCNKRKWPIVNWWRAKSCYKKYGIWHGHLSTQHSLVLMQMMYHDFSLSLQVNCSCIFWTVLCQFGLQTSSPFTSCLSIVMLATESAVTLIVNMSITFYHHLNIQFWDSTIP
jgi:hypothetical protein